MKKVYNLFCALVLYDYNIRMLHWKVNTSDFLAKHLLMDEYHEQLNSFTDELGEILMMTGNTNLPSLTEIIEMIKEDDDKYVLLEGNTFYSPVQVLSNTKVMFDHLIKLYGKIITDDDLTSDIISKLEEHQYWLRKESSYKLTSSLRTETVQNTDDSKEDDEEE